MPSTEKEWFAEWFDSPFYHILYKHRDTKEAKDFLTLLLDYLQIEPQSKILDLACGSGRHSIFLYSQGFKVYGYDLSENNIRAANNHSKNGLRFSIQDMRQPFPDTNFDFVFNLFTSFGYLEEKSENIQVLKNINEALKPKGGLVIDYLNMGRALANFDNNQTKTVDGITFNIKREVINNQLVKTILFNANGRPYSFTEKVSAFGLPEFLDMLDIAGFDLRQTFGDYQLGPYNKANADRLIIVAYKR